MKQSEAIKIILEDPDYMDLKLWKRKHFQAQEIYLKSLGLPEGYVKRIMKDVKKVVKGLKNGTIEAKDPQFVNPRPVGGSLEDEKGLYPQRGDGIGEE